MKVTFLMGNPDPKKHSTRFNFLELESIDGRGDTDNEQVVERMAKAMSSASFYIPLPVGATSSRIRVTIEEDV